MEKPLVTQKITNEEPCKPKIHQVNKANSVPLQDIITPGSYRLNPRIFEEFKKIPINASELKQMSLQSIVKKPSAKVENSPINIKASECKEKDSLQEQQEEEESEVFYSDMIEQPHLGLGKYVRQAKQSQTEVQESSNCHERMNISKGIQERYKQTDRKNKTFEEEIKDRIQEFALDKYYHFIITQIIEQGSLGHKQWVFEKVWEFRHQLVIDAYGYRIFTKCLEQSKIDSNYHYKELANFILSEEEHKQTKIFYDKYANYIVQKCLEIFDEEDTLQLLSLIKKQLLKYDCYKLNLNEGLEDLCSDQYGCLIVQKLIEIYNTREEGVVKKDIGRIIDRVISESVKLSQKQFSNYIIQQILEKGSLHHKQNLHNEILLPSNFVKLSLDKYGSNVTERAVIFSDEKQREKLWKILEKNNNDYLLNMVNNDYANYVVQQIYNISPDVVKREINNMLNLWFKEKKLKESSGQHVFNYIRKTQENNYETQGKGNNNNNGQHKNQQKKNYHHDNNQFYYPYYQYGSPQLMGTQFNGYQGQYYQNNEQYYNNKQQPVVNFCQVIQEPQKQIMKQVFPPEIYSSLQFNSHQQNQNAHGGRRNYYQQIVFQQFKPDNDFEHYKPQKGKQNQRNKNPKKFEHNQKKEIMC